MGRHRARPLLEDMKADAEEAIIHLGDRDNEAVAGDRLRALALVRAAEIVGEAASRVPQDVRAQLTDIPFRSAIAMRIHLIHGYGTVSARILADTIRDDFPALIQSLGSRIVGGASGRLAQPCFLSRRRILAPAQWRGMRALRTRACACHVDSYDTSEHRMADQRRNADLHRELGWMGRQPIDKHGSGRGPSPRFQRSARFHKGRLHTYSLASCPPDVHSTWCQRSHCEAGAC